MPDDSMDQVKMRALRVVALVLAVLVLGTVGYRVVSGGQASWVDCLYMVVITVSTIGYSEIIPMDNLPIGRVFTMVVALTGIGIIGYVMSLVTQLAVDGELQKRWRKRKMQTLIEKLGGHYILCGWSILVPQIVRELRQTGRVAVLVTADRGAVQDAMGGDAPELLIEGDPTADAVLERAGIARAAGVFAADQDDHTNIVICLAAHGLNASARIVAAVNNAGNADKLRKAGATAVVSPSGIGALRMSSEMIRPTTVSFLDVMLRDREKNLRIEDIAVGAKQDGRTIGDLKLARFANSVLLAARHGESWTYNPPVGHRLAAGDVLVVMTNPDERVALAEEVG